MTYRPTISLLPVPSQAPAPPAAGHALTTGQAADSAAAPPRHAGPPAGSPATQRPPATSPAASLPRSWQRGELATWRRRLLGFLLDCVVLTIATGALWGRLLTSFANRLGNEQSAYRNGGPQASAALGRVFAQTTAPYLIVAAFTICVAVLYYWLLTGYWGTTIGKRVVGIWVVAASDGSPVTLNAAFLRAAIFVAGGEAVPPFFLLDSLWLTWDPRRQCLHDKAAGTVVVRTATFRATAGPGPAGPARAGARH